MALRDRLAAFEADAAVAETERQAVREKAVYVVAVVAGDPLPAHPSL